MKFLYHIGKYFILMKAVFRRPENMKRFQQLVFQEMNTLGVNSLPIIAIISFFMGAVITIQTATNLEGGLIPAYTVGFATRESVILEFSPTIVALILVGKIGSSISSELGTMRVSEQIDALEIMGINSAGYLILPKIVATVLINPFLISLSMVLAISGGYIAAVSTGVLTGADYELGIRFDLKPFHYYYSLIKTVFFAYVIVTVPAYYGYFVKGGSVEVAKASTSSVVVSSITILVLNYVITQLLLI